MTKIEKDNSSTVRSLERGLLILECFKENSSLTLTEIAEITDLSITTCGRLLKTLVDTGFTEKNPQKKYTLGDNMYALLRIMSHRSDLAEYVHPSLVQLRDTYNETASLYIEQGVNRVCISSIESTHALRRTVQVGEVLPLTQGAVGDIFLAYMSHKERLGVIGEVSKEMKNHLKSIRLGGFSENDSIQEEGVYSIAVPLFDSENKNIGVISLSGPSYRVKEKRENIIKAIVFHANSISVKLGYKI